MKRMLATAVITTVIVACMALPAGAKSPKRSCVKALNAAEDIAAINTRYIDSVGTFFRQVSASADRGDVSAFLSDITASTSALTGRTNALTAELNPLVTRYNRAAAKCRAGR